MDNSLAVALVTTILTYLSPSERTNILSQFQPLDINAGFKQVGYDYKVDHFDIVRVELNRILNDTEVSLVVNNVAYAFTEIIRSRDWRNTPVKIEDFTVISNNSNSTIIEFNYTTRLTVSSNPDFLAAFDTAVLYIHQGTPMRYTMNGTRAVEGLNDDTSVRFFVKSLW